MRFFIGLSIMIVLGFMGARWVSDSAPAPRHASSGDTAALLAVVRSANSYASSPCSANTQHGFMTAITDYARRVQSAARCKLGSDGCTDSEMRSAVTRMHSPMDSNVRSTVVAAVRNGEIRMSDLTGLARLAAGGSEQVRRVRDRC